jgi:hypothetical protein
MSKPVVVHRIGTKAELHTRFGRERDVRCRQRLQALWLARRGESIRQATIGAEERGLARAESGSVSMGSFRSPRGSSAHQRHLITLTHRVFLMIQRALLLIAAAIEKTFGTGNLRLSSQVGPGCEFVPEPCPFPPGGPPPRR